ncbi:MBL fold metallo-hydrolase [Candidatus Roizmanbacteria bacterium]|nr:MBL fold metallo-hydrolase [Candidatus Roizmanbacteria bacterium]
MKSRKNTLKIITFSLGQLQANCYFLVQEGECIIIDPADDAPFILEELQRRRLKLVGMLATHGHFDHIMAAGEIQKSFNVPLYIFKEDLFLVKRINETAEYFLGFNPHSLQPTHIKYLKPGKLEIRNPPAGEAGWKLEILFTTGHTPGSCCYYFEMEKVIFTGDTLFKGAIGRYDFSYSSKVDLNNSLMRLLKLPGEVMVYPGHGERTTIRKEKFIIPNLFRNLNLDPEVNSG